MSSDIFSRVFFEDYEKGVQYRVTINEFRGSQYFHLRKYFLDFEGEWVPTKEGLSMPLSLVGTLSLFLAMSEIVSEAETSELSDTLKAILSQYKAEIPNIDDDIPF